VCPAIDELSTPFEDGRRPQLRDRPVTSWRHRTADGAAEPDIRFAGMTDDGPLFVTATGLLVATGEIHQQMLQGQPVDPSRYYMRATTASKLPPSDTPGSTGSWPSPSTGVLRQAQTGMSSRFSDAPGGRLSRVTGIRGRGRCVRHLSAAANSGSMISWWPVMA
jgi:hypothetical protein